MQGFIKEFVFATLNGNKVREIKNLCSSYNVSVKSADLFTNYLPEETGITFEENAAIKACYVAKTSGLPSLADDSGLCIHALDDQPGIYSSRWAGASKDYNNAIKKIYDKLKNTKDYRAKFVCVLALAFPFNNHIEYFKGEVDGSIIFTPKGNNGFAYDVIFVPNGYKQTFAEMSKELKNSLSHRSKAFSIFANRCLQKL